MHILRMKSIRKIEERDSKAHATKEQLSAKLTIALILLQNDNHESQAEAREALEWISKDKKHAWIAVIVAAVKSPSEFPTFNSSVEIPKHLLIKGNKMTSADMPWIPDTVDVMLNVAHWTATDSSLGPVESRTRSYHEALRIQLLDVQSNYQPLYATPTPPKEEKKLRKNLSSRAAHVVHSVSDSDNEEEKQDYKVGPTPPEDYKVVPTPPEASSSTRVLRTNPAAKPRLARHLQSPSTSSQPKKK
jgi:hypothetical protein